MGNVLDSFRNPAVEAATVTTVPTVNNYNPDVYGNNAVFNNLIVTGGINEIWRLFSNSITPTTVFTDTVDGNTGNSWHVDETGCQLIGMRYYSTDSTPTTRNFAIFHATDTTPLYTTTHVVTPGWNEWNIPPLPLNVTDLYWSVAEQIPGKTRSSSNGQWNRPEVGHLNADGCGFQDGTFPQNPFANGCGQTWVGHDVVVSGPLFPTS